jgi:hypothetical protein
MDFVLIVGRGIALQQGDHYLTRRGTKSVWGRKRGRITTSISTATSQSTTSSTDPRTAHTTGDRTHGIHCRSAKSAQHTVVESVVTLLNGLSAQLATAIAARPAIQAVAAPRSNTQPCDAVRTHLRPECLSPTAAEVGQSLPDRPRFSAFGAGSRSWRLHRSSPRAGDPPPTTGRFYPRPRPEHEDEGPIPTSRNTVEVG